MSGPFAETPEYVVVVTDPLRITTPADELTEEPTVRITTWKGREFVQVLDHRGEPLLDLSPTASLNTAMLLIEAAGEAVNRRIVRLEPTASAT